VPVLAAPLAGAPAAIPERIPVAQARRARGNVLHRGSRGGRDPVDHQLDPVGAVMSARLLRWSMIATLTIIAVVGIILLLGALLPGNPSVSVSGEQPPVTVSR